MTTVTTKSKVAAEPSTKHDPFAVDDATPAWNSGPVSATDPLPGSSMTDSDLRPEIGHLRVGSRVEVRSRFQQEWHSGFTIESIDDDGVRLRRLSDGTVLPAVFAGDEIRKQRSRSTWWS